MEQQRRKWTKNEEAVVLSQVNENLDNLTRGFKIAAEQIGRKPSAVMLHYYKVLAKKNNPVAIIEEHRIAAQSPITPPQDEKEEDVEYENKGKKWTAEEDALLLEKVKASSKNLAKCFLAVSDELQRSPKSVAYRWYRVVSKRDGVCAFGVISSQHFSKNRKNGEGVPIQYSIWRRFLNLIRNLI